MLWSRCAAALVILLASGCTPSPPSPTDPPPATAAPTAAPTAAGPELTAPPAPSATPSPEPSGPAWDDTSAWSTFVSSRSGLRIAHPPDWIVVPAERDWTMEDDAGMIESPGQDGFLSSNGEIWVTVWTAPYGGEASLSGLLAWVGQYCRAGDLAECGAIGQRAQPLCHDREACHPGLLVTFDEDVQAFFTRDDPARIVAVASWRPWNFPVPGLGSSMSVLHAFLAGMDVRPQP